MFRGNIFIFRWKYGPWGSHGAPWGLKGPIGAPRGPVVTVQSFFHCQCVNLEICQNTLFWLCDFRILGSGGEWWMLFWEIVYDQVLRLRGTINYNPLQK